MLPLPGKRPAFVFSDPAGANACRGYAKICKAIYDIAPLLYSNRKYAWGINENLTFTTTVPAFSKSGVDCVFAGTSHPQSSDYFEVNCIRTAMQQGIKTISFVDHWVNFKLRFADEEGRQIYPDEIWVVDEMAKKLAIKEGLPQERLFVWPNPYLVYLSHFWQPSFEGKQYLTAIGTQDHMFSVLFAPDPLSIRNGKAVAGFTEDEAFLQIAGLIKEHNLSVQLLLKCHPLQPLEVFQQALDNNVPCHLIEEADTLELINASDLVIGFYSNILLEAETLGKKVVRYFPGHEDADLLRHNHSLKKVTTTADLLQELKNCMHG